MTPAQQNNSFVMVAMTIIRATVSAFFFSYSEQLSLRCSKYLDIMKGNSCSIIFSVLFLHTNFRFIIKVRISSVRTFITVYLGHCTIQSMEEV